MATEDGCTQDVRYSILTCLTKIYSSFEDPLLARSEEKIKSFAIIYLVDVKEVPDFNTMYEWLGLQLRYDTETCDNHDDNGRSPYITITLAASSSQWSRNTALRFWEPGSGSPKFHMFEK